MGGDGRQSFYFASNFWPLGILHIWRGARAGTAGAKNNNDGRRRGEKWHTAALKGCQKHASSARHTETGKAGKFCRATTKIRCDKDFEARKPRLQIESRCGWLHRQTPRFLVPFLPVLFQTKEGCKRRLTVQGGQSERAELLAWDQMYNFTVVWHSLDRFESRFLIFFGLICVETAILLRKKISLLLVEQAGCTLERILESASRIERSLRLHLLTWCCGKIRELAITTFSGRDAAKTTTSAMSSGVRGLKPL